MQDPTKQSVLVGRYSTNCQTNRKQLHARTDLDVVCLQDSLQGDTADGVHDTGGQLQADTDDAEGDVSVAGNSHTSTHDQHLEGRHQRWLFSSC